jgi:hypothetical protein
MATYSAWRLWTRSGCSTLLFHFHDWLCALHCLPAPASTCCAPIRDVGPAEEPSQRQCDIHSCDCFAGPPQREPSFARFSCTLQTPQLLGFMMMAFTSRQHALEMNCGPAATSALSYWFRVAAMCENLRPALSTYRLRYLSISTAIASGPITCVR